MAQPSPSSLLTSECPLVSHLECVADWSDLRIMVMRCVCSRLQVHHCAAKGGPLSDERGAHPDVHAGSLRHQGLDHMQLATLIFIFCTLVLQTHFVIFTKPLLNFGESQVIFDNFAKMLKQCLKSNNQDIADTVLDTRMVWEMCLQAEHEVFLSLSMRKDKLIISTLKPCNYHNRF